MLTLAVSYWGPPGLRQSSEARVGNDTPSSVNTMPAAIGAGRRVRVQVRFEDRCGDRHFTFIALKLGSDPAGRIEGAASRCSLEAPHDAATSPLRTTTDRDRGGGGGPACTRDRKSTRLNSSP